MENNDCNFDEDNFGEDQEYNKRSLIITKPNQINKICVNHDRKTIYIRYKDNNDNKYYWLKISNCCENFKLDSTYGLSNNKKDYDKYFKRYYTLLTPNNQRVGIIYIEPVLIKLIEEKSNIKC